MGRVHGLVEKNPMGSEAIFRRYRLWCKVFKETKEETSFSRNRWILRHRFFLDPRPIKCSTEAVDVLRIFRGIVESMGPPVSAKKSAFLKRVQAGEELQVTSRGRIIARIAPEHDPSEEARQWLFCLRNRVSLGDVVAAVSEPESSGDADQL
jgi:antitoxin (DNA-binding transcriptional repressor) of toxin-antitoxin stability system